MDFPKYQISRMDGEYQVVYRTNDEEEFSQFLAEIKKLEIKPAPEYVKKAPFTPGTPVQKSYGGFKKQAEGEICNKCNVAKIVLNPATGKTFCADKCWLNKEKSY